MKKDTKPVKLSSYQLVLLRTMAEGLFKNYEIDIVKKDGYVDEFITIRLSNNKTGNVHLYHWFEFCIVHISNILFIDLKQKRLFVLNLLDSNIHPINTLWAYYNKTKRY